jgi:hypothetical protein
MGRDPHDRLEVGDHTARLPGDLLHYRTRTQEHFERMLRYARISAESPNALINVQSTTWFSHHGWP